MNDEIDPTQPLPATAESAPGQPAGAPLAAARKDPQSEPFHRRHSAGIALAGGALAVVLLAGGTAWGVSAAVASSQTARPAASTSQNHVAAAKASAKKEAGHRRTAHGVRGTITAIEGSTWMLHAASGATVTVRLTSTTAYGTKAKPAEQSSFTVGERVGVIGARSGDTVTATRVLMVPATKHATATPTPAPTT